MITKKKQANEKKMDVKFVVNKELDKLNGKVLFPKKLEVVNSIVSNLKLKIPQF
jgi:hypothetical protein